ncbi:MAG: hypothetical protein U9N08_06205 [Candidatus Caldatribacteriota bacterium]|nr:hypothetical protein [Candidatus Caldatribacteriota bacterium]
MRERKDKIVYNIENIEQSEKRRAQKYNLKLRKKRLPRSDKLVRNDRMGWIPDYSGMT